MLNMTQMIVSTTSRYPLREICQRISPIPIRLVYVPTSQIHAHILLSLTWIAVLICVFSLYASHRLRLVQMCNTQNKPAVSSAIPGTSIFAASSCTHLRIPGKKQSHARITTAGRCQTAGIRFSSAFALAPVSITTMSAPSAANH